MGAFRRPLLWIEGTEDNFNLDLNWSTAYSGFKRLIIWTEGTEDNNNLDINWATAYVGGFKRLLLWLEGTGDKKKYKLINCLCGCFQKTYTMDWRYWRQQWLGYKLINCSCWSF